MDNIFYFAGIFLVLLYSLDRFSTPSANKLSTTRSKYYTGLFMYLVVYVFIYHVLILLTNLESVVENIHPEIAELPKELIAAMILTMLLPVIPYVKEFDVILKGKICNMVNIPHEVSYLVRKLKSSNLFKTDNELSLAASSILVNNDFDQGKLTQLSDDDLMKLWNTATVLKEKFNKCIDPDGYKKFLDTYENKIKELGDKYDEIMPYMISYVNGGDGSIAKEKDITSNVKKSIISLLDDIYHLISRAMLSKFNMAGKKNKLLERIGFDIGDDDARMNWDIVSMIFISIFILYMIKYSIFEDSFSERKFKIILLIAFGYCTAVYWAIYPKLYWESANRNATDDRRFTYYLAVVLLTVGTVFVIRFISTSLGGGSLEIIFSTLMKYVYWQIPSAVLALLLAFLLDNNRQIVNRWVEGGIGGAVNCSSYLIATRSMDRTIDFIDFVPPFLIGVLVCSTVPYWFRRANDKIESVSSAY